MLQKMAEIMEYSELLDKAAECEARLLLRRARCGVCVLRLLPTASVSVRD